MNKQKTLKQASSIDEILQENTLPPRISLEALTDEYMIKAKKSFSKDLGANENCDTLKLVCLRLIEYYSGHTFSYENFLTLAQPFDLDINEDGLREFWNGWLLYLQGNGRIKHTPSELSAYNFSTYQFA